MHPDVGHNPGRARHAGRRILSACKLPSLPTTREAFAALAAIVYQGGADVGEAICRTAIHTVPGADHVSISTLEPDGRLHTVASSDDVARLMDQLENEAAEGPCLDSIVEDSFQRDADIAVHSTWPGLAKITLERTVGPGNDRLPAAAGRRSSVRPQHLLGHRWRAHRRVG